MEVIHNLALNLLLFLGFFIISLAGVLVVLPFYFARRLRRWLARRKVAKP